MLPLCPQGCAIQFTVPVCGCLPREGRFSKMTLCKTVGGLTAYPVLIFSKGTNFLKNFVLARVDGAVVHQVCYSEVIRSRLGDLA